MLLRYSQIKAAYPTPGGVVVVVYSNVVFCGSTMVGGRPDGEEKLKHHFVLVHGACHGAWSWYKIIPLLEASGHKVTALDLAASGARSESPSEVHSFADYARPLIDLLGSLPHHETAILVGHSNGGLCVALAMEAHPDKVSAAVFLAALMPDCNSPPSYPMLKYFEATPPDYFLDSQITMEGAEKKLPSTILFGPSCLSSRLYQNCSSEDVALAKTLMRMTALHLENLLTSPILSRSKYGSVKRVYVVCDEDLAILAEYQRWMICNYPPDETIEIKGSDHMPMLSKPNELYRHLLDISKACR